jgi:hypothetical protein
MSISSVQKIMDPLTTIFGAALEVLAPVVNDVLGPVVGCLVVLGKALGQVLTPIVQALSPVITFLAEGFMWLYNKAIMPVGNMLWATFTWIGNLLYNFGMLIYNIVTFDWMNLGKGMREMSMDELYKKGPLKEIGIDAITGAGTSETPGGTGAGYGSQTTIQHPPDINIYMTFNGPVLGGAGKREVAELVVEGIEDLIGMGVRVKFLEGP